MTAPDLSAAEKAEVARFGIHDVEPSLSGAQASAVWFDEASWQDAAEQSDTVPVETFMADRALSAVDMRELLREYRSETGWSPFEMGSRDELDSDFLNWHRWERLA